MDDSDLTAYVLRLVFGGGIGASAVFLFLAVRYVAGLPKDVRWHEVTIIAGFVATEVAAAVWAGQKSVKSLVTIGGLACYTAVLLRLKKLDFATREKKPTEPARTEDTKYNVPDILSKAATVDEVIEALKKEN